MEIVSCQSPLNYHGIKPQRVALMDKTIPKVKKQKYFEKAGLVAFVDYSVYGGDIFIHYISTRPDLRQKGHANSLIAHLAEMGKLDFGNIFHDAVQKIYEKMKAAGKVRGCTG